MAEIINMIGGEEIYIDALTSRPERFKQVVLGHLDNKDVKIIAENYADKTYPIVSAASIIAKVERDRAIDEIKKQVGFDFGVGYPHDERTIEFVDRLIKTNKKLPSYVRKSWITTQMLQEKNWQRKIKDFIFGIKKIKSVENEKRAEEADEVGEAEEIEEENIE
jgi:ribonuclease HII